MRGYLNKLEKTKETIDNEGWIHSGDIGRIDEVKEREMEQERKGYILYKKARVIFGKFVYGS